MDLGVGETGFSCQSCDDLTLSFFILTGLQELSVALFSKLKPLREGEYWNKIGSLLLSFEGLTSSFKIKDPSWGVSSEIKWSGSKVEGYPLRNLMLSTPVSRWLVVRDYLNYRPSSMLTRLRFLGNNFKVFLLLTLRGYSSGNNCCNELDFIRSLMVH